MRRHYRSLSRKFSRTWKSRFPNKILGLLSVNRDGIRVDEILHKARRFSSSS